MFSQKNIILLWLAILVQVSMAQDVQKATYAIMTGEEATPVSLQFRIVNKLIIIPVQINGSDTLHFILDTGLENSIICELETDEILELKQAREVLLTGIGPGEPVVAIQSRGNRMRVGNIDLYDQDYIILSGNELELSSKMGTKINGLLNMQSFQEYTLEIDYDRNLLTFYEPEFFREQKNLEGYVSLPMDMQDNIPFVPATITTNKDISLPVRLMLDTGAGNSLNLFMGSLPALEMPEGSRDTDLGSSITGNVKGKVGRIKGFDFGPYHLSDVLVSYPYPEAQEPEETRAGQNGSLGSEILRRFNMILDFSDHKIHLTPSRDFDDDFHFDMSGLEIQAPSPHEHRYLITGIRKHSNAEIAGIRTGDEILSINGTPSAELSLDGLYKNLEGVDGKKIRLELLREGKKVRAIFRLEKYI